MKAFSNQLQSLRRDELEKRAAFVRENLKVDQANLDAIRKKIMDFQRSSGPIGKFFRVGRKERERGKGEI